MEGTKSSRSTVKSPKPRRAASAAAKKKPAAKPSPASGKATAARATRGETASGFASRSQASTNESATRTTARNAARAIPGMPGAEQFLSGLANLAPGRLTSQVRNMAEQVMGWAGTAAEMAVGASAPLIKEPGQRAALEKAGAVLRDARETAGLTASDVSAALDFSDANILNLAESGRVALPFEVILRLASLLARNDPIPFVMNLTRFYNPGLWKIIDQLGIGKVALHVGREREFINIYRSYDAARKLRDDEFKLVLEFTTSAFRSAVDLAMLGHTRTGKAKGKAADQDDKPD